MGPNRLASSSPSPQTSRLRRPSLFHHRRCLHRHHYSTTLEPRSIGVWHIGHGIDAATPPSPQWPLSVSRACLELCQCGFQMTSLCFKIIPEYTLLNSALTLPTL